MVNRVEHDRTRRPLSLGQQLRAARLGSGLKPKDVARRAKLSVAAVYNCERFDRGGRMRTLLRLAKALSPQQRQDQGHTETTLAEKAQIAFDTVWRVHPSGNVRSLEKLCAALGQPLRLVF